MSKKLQKVEQILDEQMNPIKERQELEDKLMQMPELESSDVEKQLLSKLYDRAFENGRKAESEDRTRIEEGLDHKGELQDEYRNMTKKELLDVIDDLKLQLDCEHKRMNDINTFQAHENEVYLRGQDEWGKPFTICFDSYNFLEWITSDNLKYIKKQLTKYIKQL